MEQRTLALMRGEGRGPGAALGRGALWTLSLAYGAAITVYWWMYRFGILKRQRLGAAVISVGNITVGGTGKTTAIHYIARVLCNAKVSTAVLSYGYHAGSKDSVGVVSDGSNVLMDAAEAGDEAVLLAKMLPGVPVLIGRRRVLSGAEAVRRFHPEVLLCDDAFQYWRLHRDADLVLVDAVEPWGYGYVLPRGLMREPKSRLTRASAFMITHADLAPPDKLDRLRAELEAFGVPVWSAEHAPYGVSKLDGTSVGTPDILRGVKVLAVSSLGDPRSYETTLERLGAVVTPCRFVDHHHYTTAEVEQVGRDARDAGLRIVTTAKDAVKLKALPGTSEWLMLEISLRVREQESFETWVKAVSAK